jgi:DNA-binding transcriptional ArsR family regulator
LIQHRRSRVHLVMDPSSEGGLPEERIVLELSRAQVAKVMRTASASGAPSTLLSGLHGPGAPQTADVEDLMELAEAEERRLSRSLLSGLLVLACFPLDGSHVGIAELARRLKMSPSATHRYVSTLLAAELVERDSETRQYRLAQRLTVVDSFTEIDP